MALLPVAACVNDGAAPAGSRVTPSETVTPRIHLEDIDVSGDALEERVGLFVCGDSLVASSPASFVEPDSFVVFDPETGFGRSTKVELPKNSGLEPNARWLLGAHCAETKRGPLLVVSYQEMPLAEDGSGPGVRAAYTLDGRELWMRDDLNQPAQLVDGVLVLGPAPEQPEQIVRVTTGRDVMSFANPFVAQTVLSGSRMAVRRASGRSILTSLSGDRIGLLRQAPTYTAAGDLVFAVDPGAVIDSETGEPVDETELEEEASDGSTPDDQETGAPPDGENDGDPETETVPGKVTAYEQSTGERLWSFDIISDPLGRPTVEPRTGVVVLVDSANVAHGIHPLTGEHLWEWPTEVKHPRVTVANGVVLLDKRSDDYQALVEARTGLPLPEPEEYVVDLTPAGALEIIEGIPTLVSMRELRNPPTETEHPVEDLTD